MAELYGQQHPLGVLDILREAFKIPGKNGRLVASITLLLLAPSSFLLWAHDRAVLPLVDDDSDDGEDFRGRGSRGRLLLLETVFFLASSVVSLSAMALTVYISSAAYAGNHRHRLTLKEAVLRTLALWRGPAKTCLCAAAITVGYAFLVVMLLGALSLIAAGDALVAAAIAVLGSSAVLFYAFLAVVWVLGFAVSVVEDGCCGMDALARAARLLRGRRVQGSLLMSLLLLLGAPVAMLLYLNTREDDQGAAARVTVGVAATAFAGLLKMFAFMAFTVFYHECRRYQGEKAQEYGSAAYELLTMGATVHAANPL